MFEHNLHEVISAYVSHHSEKYEGSLNFNNERNGRGHQEWVNDDLQKYSGEFLQDSLHGKGKYTWLRPGQSYMYEGGLYANNFEGYASLVRTDGQYFEGLFKNNRRFGPGVVTYPNGVQDVGLWDGPKLYRLSCVVMPEWIPRLARTSDGKIKLLKFRKLIPVRPVETDGAKEVLRKLGANSEMLQKSNQLYNSSVRHPKSKLFNKKLHDVKYFGQMDCTIEVADTDVLQVCINSVSVNSATNNEVSEVVEILLENVDMLKDIPKEQRGEIISKDLEKAKEKYHLDCNKSFAKFLVETLLANTEDIMKCPKDERVLILNKMMVRKFLQSPEIKNDLLTKKLEVTDLLAWNNESTSTEMMKHIFLHRNMENAISFKVAKLLAGERTSFNSCGDHEKACILFLTNCSLGNDDVINSIFLNIDLHHNLCDARGNAGITFAAARDRWSIIKKLTNAGVNLDVLNDEGVTPLVLCLLRYLAIKKSINDWESAFLSKTNVTPEEKLQLKKEWRLHTSSFDLNLPFVTNLYETYTDLECGLEKLNLLNKPNPFKIPESYDLSIDPLKDVYDEIKSVEIDMGFRNFQEPYIIGTNKSETQTYVFKTDCKLPPTKAKAGNLPKQSHSSPEDYITANKLKIVFTTIKILLSCGADPNITAAPMPALIICIYCGSEELLNLLLASSANPNIVTLDDNLSPLHILATLPFSKDNMNMFRILLEHDADPNWKANAYHWMDEKAEIIGKHVLIKEDLGKTPLHILCMRRDFNDDIHDFLPEMIRHLIDFKANVREFYLGHTPFSIAVLRGNLKLIKLFLDTSSADPHEKLGEGMGVALTVPILKRYANTIAVQTAIDVYDLLMEYNVNPLRDVDATGNAVEFMYKEYEIEEELQAKKETSKKNKILSKFPKKKTSLSDQIKDYLLECTRNMLHRHIQYNAFKYLTYFILEGADLEDDVCNTLIKFLTLSDAERIIQILLRKRIFHPNVATNRIIFKTLQLIKNAEVYPKKGKIKDDQRTPEDIFNSLDFDTIDSVNKFGLIESEVDPSKNRYTVCFNCGRKVGKILIPCPNCGLVYFCSEECNKISIKKHTRMHKCDILFYNRERKRNEECLTLGLKPEFYSQLNEKLIHIKRLSVLSYLGREGRDDGLCIDLAEDFDLSGLEKGKYVNIFGPIEDMRKSDTKFMDKDYLHKANAREIMQGKIPQLEKILSETEERAKQSRIVSLDEKVRRKQKEKIISYKEDTEERKLKDRKAQIEDDAKHDLRKSRFGESIKGGETGPKKISRSKFEEKIKNRELWTETEAPDKHEKSRKRKGEVDKHQRRTRGTLDGKMKEKEEWSKKVDLSKQDGKGKSKERGKWTQKSVLDGKDTIGTPKQKTRGKSNVRMSKIGKGKEKDVVTHVGRGLLKYGGNILRQKAPDQQKGKFAMGIKLRLTKEPELERGKLKVEQSLYSGTIRKGYEVDVYPKFSKKYQHFLEVFSEFFPDLDLCTMLLPYACFVDGQLYYRFLDEKPLFCLTYSNV